MKTHNEDPNFSIVMQGGCNAACPFCFNKGQSSFTPAPMGYYLSELQRVLKTLPEQFYQISITGGEPLLSPRIIPVLGVLMPFKDKYHNILLTTNGTGLIEHRDMIAAVVDHINLSRHHWDEKENQRIFGGTYSLMDKDIKEIIRQYSKDGIDISVNCVINDETQRGVIETYVDWARNMGFMAVRFRKENGDITPTPVEASYSEHKVVWNGKCPVCRTKLQYINGMQVFWKSSTLEPSDTITDEVFEVVFQPDGNTYLDWMGKKPIDIRTIKGHNTDYPYAHLMEDLRASIFTERKKKSRRGSSDACGGGGQSSSRC